MLRSVRANIHSVILAGWLLCGPSFAQDDPMQQAITAYEAGDFVKAGQLWEPLANEGDAQAQYSIAVLYHKGQGRPADFGKALDWYRKAAEQNHVNSLFNLGVAYWEGRGVARNLQDAVQWWRRAAELEYGAAQHNLATAYYLGQGAEKNVEEAITWFRKASDNGYTRADKALNVIENKYPQLFAKAASPMSSDVPQQAVSAAAAPEASAATASIPVTVMPAETAGAPAEPLAPEQTARAAPAPEPTTPTETGSVETAAPMSGQNVARIGEQGAKVYPFYRDSLPALGELAPGSPIRVLLRHQNWVYVQVPDGFEMWVYGRYVTGESGMGTINNASVRARPLPSTASDSYPLGTFNEGETVEVLAVQGDWKRVRGPQRLGAWVKAQDVELGAMAQAQGATPAAATDMVAEAAAAMPETAADTAADAVMRVAQGGAKIYPFHRESLPEIGELLPHTTVRLVVRQGDWVYVQVPGGLEVWVYGRYVDGDSGQGTVNAADVRARPVPSTARNSYPLGTFNKGESVEVLEVQGKWKKVRAPERLGAWVKAADVVAGDNRES